MNLLILGDVMGASGRKALSNTLPELINPYGNKGSAIRMAKDLNWI